MSEFIIVFICVFFNGLLSASEMAFVTVRKSQLREAAKRGSRSAEYVLKMRDNPERTLSIVQIGITLLGAIAAAVGGVGAEETLSPLLEQSFGLSENAAEVGAIAIVVIPITYLSVVLGELIPKSLALRNALTISLLAAYLFRFLDRLLSPVISIFEWSTRRALTLFSRSKIQRPISEAEADTNIELDALQPEQREYVLNLVALSKKNIALIYTPWKDVISIQTEQNMSEVEAIIISSGHTRLPVFQSSQAIGILNSREFMALKSTGKENWQALIRAGISLQARTPLLTALRRLQSSRYHMAIVLADHAQLGIVTMEDIFEEVIGEIYDEDDEGTLKKILSLSPKRKSLF